MSTLAPTLQAFFTDRLARQRQASSHTIAAYRDACKLLLAFACKHTGKAPCHLDVADLDAALIGAFLDHLEHQRGNSVRTRNARLAAIHSLCSASPPWPTPRTPPSSTSAPAPTSAASAKAENSGSPH
jgi:integrase/recombinase XerD